MLLHLCLQEYNQSDFGVDQPFNIMVIQVYALTSNAEEAVYSQQKQDQKLTVAQIMNFLLPNSDLN